MSPYEIHQDMRMPNLTQHLFNTPPPTSPFHRRLGSHCFTGAGFPTASQEIGIWLFHGSWLLLTGALSKNVSRELGNSPFDGLRRARWGGEGGPAFKRGGPEQHAGAISVGRAVAGQIPSTCGHAACAQP